MQFKTYELFISGIFHLIISDSAWLGVIQTMGKVWLLYYKTVVIKIV
jgi:hypothetical protein